MWKQTHKQFGLGTPVILNSIALCLGLEKEQEGEDICTGEEELSEKQSSQTPHTWRASMPEGNEDTFKEEGVIGGAQHFGKKYRKLCLWYGA